MTSTPPITEKYYSEAAHDGRALLIKEIGTNKTIGYYDGEWHSLIEKPATLLDAVVDDLEKSGWKVTAPKEESSGWDERFDDSCGVGMPDGVRAEVKSFFRAELARQREEIAGEIEKLIMKDAEEFADKMANAGLEEAAKIARNRTP